VTQIPARPTEGAFRAVPGTVLLICLVLAAVNLRSTLSVVPPLVSLISDDLRLSGAATGLLTALPVACMGLFAPVAQRLSLRIGPERVVLAALALLVLGSVLRLGGGSPLLLYGGTLAIGVGIAAAGTVLPGIVKQGFPSRGGTVTGVYVLAMGLGGVVAAALAAPAATWLGSWQASLGVWALPAVVAVIAWAALLRRLPAHPVPVGRAGASVSIVTGLPWRSRTAWLTAAYMVGASTQFYSQLAWLAPWYESLGRSAAQAGLLLAVYSTAMVVGGVAAPALTDVVRDRRWLTVPCCGVLAGCLLGVVAAPEVAPWAWMVGLGFAVGALFALGLVMLVDHASSAAASGRLAALVFLVGYGVACIGPFLGGVLRDALETDRATLALLLVLAVAQLGITLRVRPGRPQV
jgi:CP family cyanate transporter-like MFS transporter